jgi:putative peptidoglycan lipid II flippase
MSQMLKSSAALASATLISRVLGLVREMAYARFMGTGWVADAFLFAFMIPNLFRRLLGEGALTAAFIPQFKALERTEGEAAMWHAANAVVSGLLILVSALTALAIVAISGLLLIQDLQAQTRLMLELLRLMFPYMAFVCLAAVGMGMLNARGRFFVPALGAALLNVVMIASVLAIPYFSENLGRELPQQIHGLALGVLAAGFAQAAFQAPSLLREGWRFRWVNPWPDPTVREVLRRMVPTTVGVAAFQINVVITQGFAFFLGPSIVASFQFAVRLMELPQGLFGASLGAYLLPTLAGLAAEKNYDRFRSTLRQGLGYLTFVNLLAAALLFGLAEPIVRLLLEGGRFNATDTRNVSIALMVLAPGLVAFSSTNILARAFYAVGDTRVPMQISVFCLAVNVVLSLIFALPFHAAGLAVANTLTSTLNTALLLYALRKKFPKFDLRGLGRESLPLGATAVGTALLAWGLALVWQMGPGHASLAARLGAVFVPAAVAASGYLALARWQGNPGLDDMLNLVRRRRSRTKAETATGEATDPRRGDAD